MFQSSVKKLSEAMLEYPRPTIIAPRAGVGASLKLAPTEGFFRSSQHRLWGTTRDENVGGLATRPT